MNFTTSKDHCVFEDWQPALPPEHQHLSRQQWEAKGRVGSGIKITRALGKRSPALYRKLDVMEFFVARFGISHPDAIQKLLDLGFPRIPAPEKKPGKL
jgi:hypothetical protein